MPRASLKSRFRLYVDRAAPGKVDRWALATLGRIGAYGRGVMKNMLRPMLSEKKHRTVTLAGVTYVVPRDGLVYELATGRPVRKAEADAARSEFYKQYRRGGGAGKPPRRGPTDKLRQNIDFGVDAKAPGGPAVVIGAYPFPRQPKLVQSVSVPDLLTHGGGEYLGGVLVHYEPRPFVGPTLPIVEKRLGQTLERRPVG